MIKKDNKPDIKFIYNKNYLTYIMLNKANNKKTYLPHGCGIDYDYNIINKKDKYIISNCFHYMNEYGFYDGILPFSLYIPKNDILNFKIRFNDLNSSGYYRVNKIDLKTYLNELYYNVFEEVL